MHSYEERIRAVKLYEKYGKRAAAVIRELGYLDRHVLAKWYQEYIIEGTLKEKITRKPKYAPLRAVIDVVVHSVGENYYNHFIEQQIPDKPIKESLLIMNTLAAYPLGIYVFWLELRIQKMIDDGKLIVTEAPDGLKLHRVLQKAGKG